MNKFDKLLEDITPEELQENISDLALEMENGGADLNEKEELLVIFMEECAEVSVEASKMIRFGGDKESMEREVGDLLCMVELLKEYGIIREGELPKHINAKRKKLKNWSNLNFDD
jgi:hypothetical protein